MRGAYVPRITKQRNARTATRLAHLLIRNSCLLSISIIAVFVAFVLFFEYLLIKEVRCGARRTTFLRLVEWSSSVTPPVLDVIWQIVFNAFQNQVTLILVNLLPDNITDNISSPNVLVEVLLGCWRDLQPVIHPKNVGNMVHAVQCVALTIVHDEMNNRVRV